MARLTISNPGKRGALDHAILDAFATTLPELDARCVIITGEGRTFSAGYDIGDLPEAVFADEAEKLVAHPFAAALDASRPTPTPRWPRSTATRSAAGSSWRCPAICGSPPGTIALGMPPAKLGLVYSHTGIRKFIDTIGAPRTRELFLVGRPDRRRARRATGGWSTRVSEPSGWPRRRSSWRPRSPATRRWPRRATSA